MKNIKLFENFINEAKLGESKLEAAEASNGMILLKGFGKFIGRLSFAHVYYKDVNKDRNEKIKNIFLKTFPASEEWKKDCNNYMKSEIFGSKVEMKENEKPILAAFKIRAGNGEIGEIQIWDESKLEHTISISGPFQGASHNIGGKYAGGIYFAKTGVTNDEAKKIGRELEDMFKGNPKTKKWEEPN